ncbi:MAG: flagellar hook-length control protein FliK, partial [Burkholderiaceae bacterium]
ANATVHTAAMAVAPTAIDATATATLATELAALAQTASGDEAIADGRPATPAAPTSVSTATAAAAPMPPGANPAPSAAPALPALPAAPLPSSPGQPAFAGEFGHRVMLMAHGQVKSAQIALNPGELGPVEVRLELRGQEASLVMSAAHPATRAALEDALPRLREMFAAQGLELADAQVGADSRGESASSGEGRPRRGGSEAAANAVASPPAASLQAHGLIDTFA